MNNLSKYLVLAIITVCTHTGLAQINPANNTIDKNGLRQGKWLVMLDSLFQETKDSSQARLYRQIAYKNNKPQGITTEYYPSGLPYWRGKIVSEKPLQYDSTVEHYYPNGQVQYRYSYKNNQVHGKAYEYYEFGELKTVSNYVDGKLDGPYQQFHINGNQILNTTYRYGQIDGAYTEYHSNGIVRISGLLDDDKKQGDWQIWNDQGTLLKTERYVNDQLQPTSAQAAIPQNENRRNGIGTRLGTFTYMFDEHWDFTQNPVEAHYYRIMTYKDNKPVGTVTDYYVSGQKQWEGKLLSDIPDVIHGKSTTYYESGKIQKVEKYKKGKRHGKRTYYYEDGSIEEVDQYKNGELNGWSTLYYDNGVIKQKVNHVNGKQDGLVTLNYKNGQPKTIGHMDMGVKNGKWTWYNEDGTVKSSYDYKNGELVLHPKPETLTEKHIKSRDQFTASGNIDSALYYGQKAYLQAKKDQGSTDRLTLSCAFALGKLYFRSNKIQKADSIFQEVSTLEIISGYEKTYDHINTLRLLASTQKLLNNIGATEKLLLRQERIITDISKEPNLPLAVLYNELGTFYQQKGDNAQAKSYFEKSVKTYEAVDGTSGIQYAQLLENIGQHHLSKNQGKLALYYFHEALTNYHTFFPNESDFNTVLLDDLGQTHELLGNLETAKRYYEEAMLIRKNIYGERHVNTASSYLLLANIHSKMGMQSRAESLFLITMGIYEHTYGKLSFEYTSTNNSLAEHYSRSGRLTKATFILENNLSIYKIANQVQGQAQTYLALAKIYHKHYEFSKATNYYNKALELYTKQLSDKVTEIDILNRLGDLNTEFRKFEIALSYYQKGIERTKDLYGKKSLEYAECLTKVADIAKHQSQYDIAIKNYSASSDLIQNQLGEKSSEYGISLIHLAETWFLNKDTTLAIETYNKALNALEQQDSRNDKYLAMGLYSYGNFQLALGQHSNALQSLNRTKQIHISNYDTENIDYANTLFSKAQCNLAQEQYLETLTELVDAARIYKGLKGENSDQHIQTLGHIAFTYEQLHMYPDAQLFYQKAYDICIDHYLSGTLNIEIPTYNLCRFLIQRKDFKKSVSPLNRLIYNDYNIIINNFLLMDSTTKYNFITTFFSHIELYHQLNSSLNNPKELALLGNQITRYQAVVDTIFKTHPSAITLSSKDPLLIDQFQKWEETRLRVIHLQTEREVHYEEIVYLQSKALDLEKTLSKKNNSFQLILNLAAKDKIIR